MKHSFIGIIALYAITLSLTAMEQATVYNLADTLGLFGPSFFSAQIVPYIRDEDIKNIKLTSKKCHQCIRNWCQSSLQYINGIKEGLQNNPKYIPESLTLNSTNSLAYVFGYEAQKNPDKPLLMNFGLFTYCLPIIDKPQFSTLNTEIEPVCGYPSPKNLISHTPYYLNLVMYHGASASLQIPRHIVQDIIFLNKNGQITIKHHQKVPSLVEPNSLFSPLVIFNTQKGISHWFYPEQKIITYKSYSHVIGPNRKPTSKISSLFPIFVQNLLETKPTKEILVSQQEIDGIMYHKIEKEYDSIPPHWNNAIAALRSFWKLYHDYQSLISTHMYSASLEKLLIKYSPKQCADMCVALCMNSPTNLYTHYPHYSTIKTKILEPHYYTQSINNKRKDEFDTLIKEVQISPTDYSMKDYRQRGHPLPKPTTTQQLISFFRFNDII